MGRREIWDISKLQIKNKKIIFYNKKNDIITKKTQHPRHPSQARKKMKELQSLRSTLFCRYTVLLVSPKKVSLFSTYIHWPFTHSSITLMPIYPYAARLQGSLRKDQENEQRVKKNKSLQYSHHYLKLKKLWSTVLWLSWNVLTERK